MSRWRSFSLMFGLLAFCFSAQAATPSGTFIPPATQIVDSNGATWIVSGGVVFKNGSGAGYTASVVELLYLNGTIYQENSAGGWWSWNGSGWIGASKPLSQTGSASGTTIPPATQIVDASGNVWIVSGGVVFKNGSAAGYSANVIDLVYLNGIIHQENTAKNWWSWNGSGWASANNPLVTNAACGSTPSGSTVTQTVSTTSGSIAATTAQCPYGGTRPTTTTVTQVQLCTNGTLANQGAPVTTTVNSGNPTCNTASVNGACGSSNGMTLSSAPTTGLCSTGTASGIAGGGPWSWSCAGSNGGSTAQCSSNTAETVLYDNQAYTSGPYLAYMSAWGKGSYIEGPNYTESMTLIPSAFPNDSAITWNWPEVQAPYGVYNYLSIEYGNYDETVVQTPITPQQVRGITTLSETHNFTVAGQLTGFDVIDDMFLTPNSGDQSVHLFEIEVFMHTPPGSVGFVQSVQQVGSVNISGVTWTVAIYQGSNPDILFMPTNEADVNGTVDLKAVFNYLISKGILTGNEWFNGFGTGVEVQEGYGSATFNSFSVTYN
jgi:hypothetical protein